MRAFRLEDGDIEVLLGRVEDLRRKRAEVSKLERFTKRNKGPKGCGQATLLALSRRRFA